MTLASVFKSKRGKAKTLINKGEFKALRKRIDCPEAGSPVRAIEATTRYEAMLGMDVMRERNPKYLANLMEQAKGAGFAYAVVSLAAEFIAYGQKGE